MNAIIMLQFSTFLAIHLPCFSTKLKPWWLLNLMHISRKTINYEHNKDKNKKFLFRPQKKDCIYWCYFRCYFIPVFSVLLSKFKDGSYVSCMYNGFFFVKIKVLKKVKQHILCKRITPPHISWKMMHTRNLIIYVTYRKFKIYIRF